MRNVDPQYYRENRVVVADGQLAYQSKFQLVDLLVKLQFPVGAPARHGLPRLHPQLRRAGQDRQRVRGGRRPSAASARPGPGGRFFVYQYIGRDALVGAYNTDDWWWHTWAEGYRFGARRTRSFPMVYVQPAVVFQRRLDYDYWINRVTVDLVKMF